MKNFHTRAGIYLTMIAFLLLFQRCATARLGNHGQRKISGKVIIVTGASSGLGRGVALEAARYGAKVVLASRNKTELEKVAAEIRQNGGTAIVVPTDVSIVSDIKRLADTTVAVYGKIDVWINNAGVTVIGNFWNVSLREQSRVFDVNLNGVLYGCYYAMQQFKVQGYGTLINIGSVESEIPTAYQVAYAASKAAVRSIGLSLRQELRLSNMDNIKVITISPYALDTPIWDHAANHTGHAPRMMAMDHPQKAINVVMHACIGKRREMPVGWKAHLSYLGHRVFPAWTERLGSNMTHKYQAEITPAVPETEGNLFRTMPTPGVEGGIKERMKEERKQRKSRKQ
jgi:short-subunit dehydrogenase